MMIGKCDDALVAPTDLEYEQNIAMKLHFIYFLEQKYGYADELLQSAGKILKAIMYHRQSRFNKNDLRISMFISCLSSDEDSNIKVPINCLSLGTVLYFISLLPFTVTNSAFDIILHEKFYYTLNQLKLLFPSYISILIGKLNRKNVEILYEGEALELDSNRVQTLLEVITGTNTLANAFLSQIDGAKEFVDCDQISDFINETLDIYMEDETIQNQLEIKDGCATKESYQKFFSLITQELTLKVDSKAILETFIQIGNEFAGRFVHFVDEFLENKREHPTNQYLKRLLVKLCVTSSDTKSKNILKEHIYKIATGAFLNLTPAELGVYIKENYTKLK